MSLLVHVPLNYVAFIAGSSQACVGAYTPASSGLQGNPWLGHGVLLTQPLCDVRVSFQMLPPLCTEVREIPVRTLGTAVSIQRSCNDCGALIILLRSHFRMLHKHNLSVMCMFHFRCSHYCACSFGRSRCCFIMPVGIQWSCNDCGATSLPYYFVYFSGFDIRLITELLLVQAILVF